MESNSACANASGCSDSSSSASASHGRFWPSPIPGDRRSIKKTSKNDEGRLLRPLGSGRSPLSAAGVALSHVGAARNQRPCGLPSPHTQERRLLRSHAPTRRPVLVSARNRAVQRRELLGISQSL